MIHWAAGISWLLSIPVVGLLAAGLFVAFRPFWQALTLGWRQRLALAPNERVRKLAACNAHLIAYHRGTDSAVTMTAVMTFKRLLETPPQRRHREIRNAIRGLRASARFQSVPGPQKPAALEPVLQGRRESA
jgi:hypothetical protein